jgi:hypothetical protein
MYEAMGGNPPPLVEGYADITVAPRTNALFVVKPVQTPHRKPRCFETKV